MVGALLTFISMAVFVAWSTTWRIHSRDVGGFVPPLVNAILAFLFAAILVVGILNVLWSYSSPTEASSCVCRACRPFPRKDKDLR